METPYNRIIPSTVFGVSLLINLFPGDMEKAELCPRFKKQDGIIKKTIIDPWAFYLFLNSF